MTPWIKTAVPTGEGGHREAAVRQADPAPGRAKIDFTARRRLRRSSRQTIMETRGRG